jgi:hypothetical protein
MSNISPKDIKKLWGLSAGVCAAPGCGVSCIQFLGGDATVIGEMAHVIAKRAGGPRGITEGGEDTYENTILLCPTCHTKVDKASAGTYTEELLLKWKLEHEETVHLSLQPIQFQTKDELFKTIGNLLTENKTAWKTYGPESDVAIGNPLSAAAEIWSIRKITMVVPNNQRIVNMVTIHRRLLNHDEYEIARKFAEHAAGFEENCYERHDGVPKFPAAFAEMVGVK